MPETPAASPGPPWTAHGSLPCSAGRLYFAECGDGPPLVLLPKLGGWLADWRHVAARLAPRHRVIALDHGLSVMAGPPPYLQTVPESAASIMAALDTLGVDRFALAGNSLGGCIGIAMAAMWPGMVQRLALVGVSLAGRMSMADIAAGDAAQLLDAFDADGRPLPRSAFDLRRFGPLSEAVLAEQNASRAACGRWLRPSERGVGRMGIEAYLPRLDLPVLLINGALGYYAKYADTARRLIPRSEVITIPDAGPFLHQDLPDLVAGHIGRFLLP
jgi:pimeloyl-ACP methyl ester carboxylesterase